MTASILLLAAGDHGEQHNASAPVFLVIGVLWIVVGTAQALRPEAFWRFGQRFTAWQYKNREALEPSEAALRFRRVASAVIAVAGVVVVIVALTHI